MNYQMFTFSDCKDIGIRNFEFVVKLSSFKVLFTYIFFYEKHSKVRGTVFQDNPSDCSLGIIHIRI